MATKKDLVEAYSFSRRRLVTAFVSGAPGGREVEPTRPGRAIIGGLALAVLLVAGGAVLGILKSPTVVDLDQAGKLVSEKETGADYLVLAVDGSDDTELRPLANITSAMLVIGSDLEAEEVPRSEINDRQIGDPIGILDAPATPPQPADLVQDGWSACTGVIGQPRVGIKLDVSDPPQTTPTPDVSFLVRTESGGVYVIAQSFPSEQAYAYFIPDGQGTGRIAGALTAQELGSAVPVPDRWITMFPIGGELKLRTFGLEGADLEVPWPLRDQLNRAGDAEIGDLLLVGDDTYLMTRTGVLELDEFSDTLYRNLQLPERPKEFSASQRPGGIAVTEVSDLDGVNWPREVRGERPPTGQLCAQLDTSGTQPGVSLATTTLDSEASAGGVAFDAVDRSVDSGAGAFVQSGGWSGVGPTAPVLVDARAYAYPVGPGDETGNLGYADVAPVVVPQDWLDLFQPGVALTIDAARCPPTSSADGSCS